MSGDIRRVAHQGEEGDKEYWGYYVLWSDPAMWGEYFHLDGYWKIDGPLFKYGSGGKWVRYPPYMAQFDA